MGANIAELIHNRVPDRKGNVLPADVSVGTYDLRNLHPGSGSLTQGNLAVAIAFGSQIQPDYPECCGVSDPEWGVDDFDLAVDDVSLDPIYGLNECNGDSENVSGDFFEWGSADTAIALVTSKNIQGVSAGTTTGSASGDVAQGVGGFCAIEPVQVTVPVNVGQAMTLVGNTCQSNPDYLYGGNYANANSTCFLPSKHSSAGGRNLCKRRDPARHNYAEAVLSDKREWLPDHVLRHQQQSRQFTVYGVSRSRSIHDNNGPRWL